MGLQYLIVKTNHKNFKIGRGMCFTLLHRLWLFLLIARLGVRANEAVVQTKSWLCNDTAYDKLC